MNTLVSMEVFSKRLKSYMEKSNITPARLAEITGVSYNCATSWLRGERYPRVGKLEIMADYFKCKKSDLIEESNDSEVLSGVKLRLEGLTEFELDEVNDYITMLLNRRSKR